MPFEQRWQTPHTKKEPPLLQCWRCSNETCPQENKAPNNQDHAADRPTVKLMTIARANTTAALQPTATLQPTARACSRAIFLAQQR
jgi:hypothetical protein